MRALLILTLCLGSTAAAQSRKKDPPKPPPPVDEYKVQQAIQRGIKYLRTAPSPASHAGIKDSDELILWTFVHAHVSESDPKFKQLFNKMMNGPLAHTYKVALQAMILEELDRVKYQHRIAQCAQFLVDNQCQNGQWSYGKPSKFVNEVKVPEIPKSVSTGVKKFTKPPAPGERVKPKVVQKVVIKKLMEGRPAGDNSNSQYAALGLRACFDSGILVPKNVVYLAVKWWREAQWRAEKKEGVYGGRGWNYKDPRVQPDRKPYHSMTAGGTSSLIIYDYMLRRKWQSDSWVKGGMKWLGDKFSVNQNYYYMYGLERTGILFGTETIGDRYWYAEGVKFLLGRQNKDGSWGRRNQNQKPERITHDTCFVILFLGRATRPLVATEAGGR